MSADTRGIRELAAIEFKKWIVKQPENWQQLSLEDFWLYFAESIVEQCCKVEIRHVDILCAPERWDVLLNGKRVHYFGYEHEAEELKENIESAIRSRWQRGEGQ